MSDNSRSVLSNAKECVAYDLMDLIAGAEAIKDGGAAASENPRQYYLKLYEQTFKVVSGESAVYALK